MSCFQCPRCGSVHLVKNGHKRLDNQVKQRYLCRDCGSETIVPNLVNVAKPAIAKQVVGGMRSANGNVLVIGDTHLPFAHRNYLDFVVDVCGRYNCKTVVHIGDVFDNHSISYHEKDPNGLSAGQEFDVAKEQAQAWIERFPNMFICTGNHDMLPTRQARTNGLPRVILKSYNEIWGLPDTWEWGLAHEIDGVRYIHGTGKAGKYMYVNWAIENLQSTVSGHGHSSAGIYYQASQNNLIFGLGVGCGLDIKSYAMQYGENFARRPVLGCGVVLNYGTLPIFCPMELS